MYNLTTDSEKYFLLGKVIKTTGYKGRMVIVIDADDPGKYDDLEMIFIDINRSLVPWFIEDIDIRGDLAHTKLEDIDNPESAQSFTGRNVYLPADRLSDSGKDHFYFHEVVGFRVVDEAYGEIGHIAEIIDRPEQEIIRIMRGKQEILIPLAESMIDGIDKETKTLFVNTPSGLIDLYLE